MLYFTADKDYTHVILTYTTMTRYLRSLVELLLPYLIPENRLTAPQASTFIRELVSMAMVKNAVDLIAAPDLINLLVRMLLDPESMKVSFTSFVQF